MNLHCGNRRRRKRLIWHVHWPAFCCLWCVDEIWGARFVSVYIRVGTFEQYRARAHREETLIEHVRERRRRL